ncbi:NAD(P)-dependent oxidoreductase [Sulfitobacter donghicola]|nr:NAD(P)-dependent oxidoreductase [Sulfitobacter donghicola]
MRIGVIGCGNMGGGMAAQLLAAGKDVTCFDPHAETLEKIVARGAKAAETPSQLAQSVDVIILSLPKAAVVDAVMRDMLSDIRPDTVILDTSTSEPTTSQAMTALGAEHGFAFVDGPVSGGPAAANAGTMTMLLGGAPDAIEILRPVLDVITAKTVTVGGSGAGHAAKIANNMLCAANLVLVGEALRLGKAAGVAPQDLLEGINAGSGRSGVSEVNFPKWILNDAFDSGFTMGLMRKDVGLALALAKETKVDISGFQGLADIWLNHSDALADNADFNEIVKVAKHD